MTNSGRARSGRLMVSLYGKVSWAAVVGLVVVLVGSACAQDSAPTASSTTPGSTQTPDSAVPATTARTTGTSAPSGTPTTGDEPSTTFFTVAKAIPNGAKWDAFTDKGGESNGKFRARIDYTGPNQAEIQVFGPDATINGSKLVDMVTDMVTQGYITDVTAPKLTTLAGQDAATVTGTYNNMTVVVIVTENKYGNFAVRMDSPPADLAENTKTFNGVIESLHFIIGK